MVGRGDNAIMDFVRQILYSLPSDVQEYFCCFIPKRDVFVFFAEVRKSINMPSSPISVKRAYEDDVAWLQLLIGHPAVRFSHRHQG